MFDKKTISELHILLPGLPMIIGETSLRHDIDDIVALALPVECFAVIDDVNTSHVFGDKVYNALKGRFNCVHITLKDGVAADDETVEYIRAKTSICDALIAVGGGTINDLCKYAAHLDKKPYVVFPTCASMNGYLSANASITLQNHKTTLPAQLPKAVFCDLGVISSAPVRLAKSGLGDSLARPTAQTDWLLSHLLLNSFYDEKPFELLTAIEPELFDNAAGIVASDPATIATLLKSLLLSGIGMTIAKGSYPASQGEHMIAHTYNMLRPHSDNKFNPLHGEEIGITTLYMARRQDKILKAAPKLYNLAYDENYMSKIFGEHLAAEFKAEFAKKQALIPNNIIPAKWDDIRDKIEKIMIIPAKLEDIMKKAQLLAAIESLGWDDKSFATACNTARFTRSRFTFLDLE